MFNLEATATVTVPHPRDPAVPLTVPVHIEFVWVDTDPLALHMLIQNDPSDITNVTNWVFAVDLLRHGLYETSGPGDVTVWSTPPADLFILLNNGRESCVLSFDYEPLFTWVSQIPRNPEIDLTELDEMLDNGFFD